MKTDEELKKSFSITLENDLIILTALSIEREIMNNARGLRLIAEALEEIFKGNPDQKFNLLIDLSPIASGFMKYAFPAETRDISIEIGGYPALKKIALLTKSMFAKTMFDLIVAGTGRQTRIKSFTSKEDALQWFGS